MYHENGLAKVTDERTHRVDSVANQYSFSFRPAERRGTDVDIPARNFLGFAGGIGCVSQKKKKEKKKGAGCARVTQTSKPDAG
jgi:hypothetical protein